MSYNILLLKIQGYILSKILWSGGNENEELGKKNLKRERKREEKYMKKGLKNASFRVINFHP